MTAPAPKVLRRKDDMIDLLRQRKPFRTRARLYDRFGNEGPFVSLSGLPRCNDPFDGVRLFDRSACTPAIEVKYTYVEPDWPTTHPRSKEERSHVEHGMITGLCHAYGSLPGAYFDSFLASTYVVRSFATPIAWHIDTPADWSDPDVLDAWLDDRDGGLWVMPKVTYSVTTTSHQSDVRSALEGWHWNADQRRAALPLNQFSLPGAPARVTCGGR